MHRKSSLAVGVAQAALALAVSCGGDSRDGLDAGVPSRIEAPAEASAPPQPPPACSGVRCSPDLRAVLDNCSGDVVTACGVDTGCFEGSCIPACESAARAQGSLGCEFYTTLPDTLADAEASCFAAFIANTWSTPVRVQAELGNQALDISKSLYRIGTAADGTLTYEALDAVAPGEVGVLFLAAGPRSTQFGNVNCPLTVQPAHSGVVVSEHETGRYPAFRISTDRPISAYSTFPYGGSLSFIPSSTLLLPTSSWRSNYVLVDGWTSSQRQRAFVQIVSQQDGTEVRIRPRVDVRPGVDVQGALAETVSTWTLDRGQVLEFVQADSLIGSPLESSHPVALFGGAQCSNLPSGVQACDTLQQQIAPIEQWGTRASAVPYRSRRGATIAGGTRPPEATWYRVVAATDGTDLSYDPQRPLGAPLRLAAGEVSAFASEIPFTVRSQDAAHPFYAAVHMSGAQAYRTLGDPDFVGLVPDQQFLDEYVFYVDYTYADSMLSLVRRRGPNGFADVELECLGTVGGWEPLGSDGTVEYATVNLTLARAPVGVCGYGRHVASSAEPFGLYVWGVDTDASYGYAGGAGSRAVSQVPPNVVVR